MRDAQPYDGEAMTDTLDSGTRSGAPAPSGPEAGGTKRPLGLRAAVVAVCGLLGFLLVAQVRATETLDDRLAFEREEDLAVILADLTAQSDRLQGEISDLRLLLFEFESTVESEELARRSLEQRLDDLRILAGVVPAENEGVVLTIEDPQGQVTHDRLVDVVHDLRDSGAEAVAVNGTRLVANSAFATRNQRLVLDGEPLDAPYRVAAVGPAEALETTLGIPGGALDSLSSLSGVEPAVEQLAQLTIPARENPAPFVYGEPVPDDLPSG